MRTDAQVTALTATVAALGVTIDRFIDGFRNGGNGSGDRRR